MRIITLAAMAALFACNAPDTTTDHTSIDSNNTNVVDSSLAQPSELTCYLQVTGRDTVLLQLQKTGDSLSGSMRFDNYQKDSSHGTVSGHSTGDTLVLWYSFFSEGMHSVVEIVLKRQGNDLVRGMGDITNRGDTALFQNQKNINFDPKQTLFRIECAQQK
jgi:hypothetical protein